MPDAALRDCLQASPAQLERVRWTPYQVVTADTMTAMQDYVLQKLRRHNRFLHGWGSVCGLEVAPAALAKQPWRVRVGSGYALGPFGDEIFVGEPVFLDLAKAGPGAATDPCEPELLRPGRAGGSSPVYVAIKYAECLARPVQTMAPPCGCEESACEYSRVRDSFEVACLGELPASHQPPPPGPTLCELLRQKKLLPCPPCPSEPWVVLARVNLPASPTAALTTAAIDNFTVRRQVFSTAVLQQQLIECCCKERPPEPEGADLRIEAKVSPALGDGRTLDVRLTVTNAGPAEAREVTVTDSLTGAGQVELMNFLVDPTQQGLWTDKTPMQLAAKLGDLPAGAQVVLGFRVRIFEPNQGTLVNTAEVTSGTPDPDPTNNRVVTETQYRRVPT